MKTIARLALLLCIAAPLSANQPPATVGDCCPGKKPPKSLIVDGYFLEIPSDCMVRNVGGNCGFCSIEICGRYLGIETLHGFSKGKHGCTSSSMASWLDRYDIEYKNATSRKAGIDLMKESLADGRPVLFSIPGHALVCCGWTRSSNGREYIWVVDNTGREGCMIRGWPKAEFDRRYDGWVCAIFPNRPRILPLLPKDPPATPPTPVKPAPGPHVEPTPEHLASPLAKLVSDMEARLKGIEQKQPEILATVATVKENFGGLLKKANEDLPQLNALVAKLAGDGVLTDAKAQKAHDFLEKIGAVLPKVLELDSKVAPIVSAIPWGTILGSLGAGGSVLSILLGLFGAFAKAKSGGGDLATIISAITGLREAIHNPK